MDQSDDAVQQVKEMINYYNYFQQMRKSVSAKDTDNLSLFCYKAKKLHTMRYLKHQLYVRALIAYETETVSGKLNANRTDFITISYGIMPKPDVLF